MKRAERKGTMMKIFLLFFAGILCPASCLVRAQVPEPAPPQTRPVALVGGTAHLGNGQVIQNAVVSFENGTLTAVADLSGIRIDRSRYQVIDTTGKHIYPGLILAVSSLGLTEVNALRATIDRAETGAYNPNVRSLIAYNTDSEMIPTLRYNGILTAQVKPGGGIISGTSSIVRLDAWNWEDAAYRKDDGIHLNWPERMLRRFDFATFSVKKEPNKQYETSIATLDKLFAEAAGYQALANPKASNLKLAALVGLFSGDKTLFLYASDARPMIEGVRFAERHGVKKVVIVGGDQALMIKDFLKEKKVPVILTNIHDLPETPEEDVDMPFKLPSLLHEAGISFCITQESLMNARNIPFNAGTAAAYGLGREEALKAITGSVAKILGIDHRVGTLETGKDATLIVSTGDLLDIRTSHIEHAFIQGRKLNLPGRQQALFERYKKKYQSQNK